MDVVTAIMNDHRLLEGLLAELEAPDADRVVLVAEVRARLTAHSHAEERHVYPTLAKVMPSEAGEVHHGVEEHREAEEKLAALENASDEAFPQALAEFVSALNHHVKEEESEILPAIKAGMSSRKREQLCARFESYRVKELKRAGIEDTLTKEDLYIKAQRAGIPGRSSMQKGELARALFAIRQAKRAKK